MKNSNRQAMWSAIGVVVIMASAVGYAVITASQVSSGRTEDVRRIAKTEEKVETLEKTLDSVNDRLARMETSLGYIADALKVRIDHNRSDGSMRDWSTRPLAEGGNGR